VWGVVTSAEAWRVVGTSFEESGIELGWVSFSPTEALDLLDQGGVDHVLVEARGDYLTADIVTHADGAEASLVALMTTPGSDELANRLGVAERVRTPRDLATVSTPVAPVAASRDTVPGLVVGVWGPAGAPGRTLIATTLATLMAEAGYRTLLVDADQRSGAIAPALGLLDEVPGFVACARLADRGQLTVSDLHRLAHHYRLGDTGCDVLTGVVSQRSYSEVTPESVAEVVALCRNTWEVVVVDVGSDIALGGNAPKAHEVVATTVLETADEALAICQATTIGVARFARVYAEAVAHRHRKPLTVILNGVDASRRSVKDEATLVEALRRFAGVTSPMVVQRDSSSCRAADMAGESLTVCAGSSPIVKALGSLARRLSEPVAARRRRGQPPVVTDRPPTSQKAKAQQHRQSRWAGVLVRWRQLLALR